MMDYYRCKLAHGVIYLAGLFSQSYLLSTYNSILFIAQKPLQLKAVASASLHCPAPHYASILPLSSL